MQHAVVVDTEAGITSATVKKILEPVVLRLQSMSSPRPAS
jgi:hypothetical protein